MAIASTDMERRVESAKLNNNRSYVEWVELNRIFPNPLNPRKNDGINTKALQQILKKRGWEEPITAYQRGKNYIVLAGHRRLFAAKEAGNVKQIPVYVVEAPKTHQEEIERIASLQSGRVDWTAWEWARYSYERWIAWGKPGLVRFAKDINLSKKTVEDYVKALDYFPNEEIEANCKNGTFAITTLADIARWIRELKETHVNLVEDLSEELIRRSMLTKLEKKKVVAEQIRKRHFLKKVKDSTLKAFFLNGDMTLEEIMIKEEFDTNEKTFHGKMVSLGMARRNVKAIAPKNKNEALKAFEHLKELQESVANQLKDIERKYPDTVKKDELFEW